MALIAGATSFVSCDLLNELEDFGAPMINLAPSELTFEAGEGSQNITVTATLNWKVTTDLTGKWVALSQESGNASKDAQTISVSVEANEGFDREIDIVFAAGGMVKATLKVTQKGGQGTFVAEEGDGSKEKPFNVAQAVEAVSRLSWTDNTTYEKIGPYYVKGKIAAINDAYSSAYGNATFVISDDGNATGDQFTAYRIYYLENKKWVEGNKQISVGDVAIIYGELMYFGSGTDKPRVAETVQKGSYLYSLNGETVATGGVEVDYNSCPEITVADLIAKGDEATYYKLTGTVSKFNSNYCSFDLTDATGSIYVYSVANKTAWDGKIKNGATVTLAGKYKLYKKNDGSTQNEIVEAQILSCEGGADVDYSQAPEITVAEIIAKGDEENYYKLTGKVSGFNATYCSFDLTDATGTIYVYSVANKADWTSKITNGGTVTLAGKYQLYKKSGNPDQPEIVNAYILSFEGGEPAPEDDPKGTGTLDDPFNPKAAYDAAAKLAKDQKSDNDVYIKGKIASVKYFFSANYGTATFNITEDGTTNGTQFPCYSILYLGNKQWEDGDAQIAVGDEVIVCGKITNYGGNTPETASKEAYLYSLNGKTSIEQSAVFDVESKEITVGGAATSAVIKVKGNVAWTASSTTAQISPASGRGAGEITVTFAANTDPDNTKVYSVTLKTEEEVTNKEIVVTITQNKALGAGAGEAMFDQTQLAAAAAGGATVAMDDVISFVNSSSYSGSVTELRVYKGKTLTVKAASGYTIQDIEFVCTASDTAQYGPGCFTASPEGYTYSGKQGRWAGSAPEVVFTAGSNQVRIVELKVHYTAN